MLICVRDAPKTLTARFARRLGPFVALLGVIALGACGTSRHEIAVIPRTTATLLTEAEHSGIAHASIESGIAYYWNAPMRDDDVQGQLDLLEKTMQRRPEGLILSPDETLPFRTPIQKIAQHGTPTVILGTDLMLPPNDRIAYVLNNEQEGAKLAAEYLGQLLRGHGSVVIIGIRPQLTTTSERARAFEAAIHTEYPKIVVVQRSLASATFSQEQLNVEALLRSRSDVQAIVALTDASTRGAFLALQEGGSENRIHLIGFDQDLIVPLSAGGIDAVVMQDTNKMGRDAVHMLIYMIHGEVKTNHLLVSPVLVTKENYKSTRVREILDQRWYAK
jgi:ribose transport system substrate-binding protein